MPRSRLAWRWFAAWCLLVAAVSVGCQWLASVEMARLADSMQVQQLIETAGRLSAILPDDPAADRSWIAEFTRGTGNSPGSFVEVFDTVGQRIVAAAAAQGTPPSADGKGLDAGALAEALDGRRSTSGRYDASNASRTVSVVSPIVRAGGTTAIVRVTGNTKAADAGLALAQRRLVMGALLGAVAALLAGWLLARRMAGPFEDLANAASQVAAGAIEVPLPEPLRRTEALMVLGLPPVQDAYRAMTFEYRISNVHGFRRIRLFRAEREGETVNRVELWKFLNRERR